MAGKRPSRTVASADHGRDTGKTPEDDGEPGNDLVALLGSLGESNRLGVWRTDARHGGMGYLQTVTVPKGQDADWLMDYLRSQFGPGSYSLRPKGPRGRYLKGAAHVELAEINPPPAPMNAMPRATGAGQGSEATIAIVLQLLDRMKGSDGKVETELVRALLQREEGERSVLAQVIGQRTDTFGDMERAIKMIGMLQNVANGQGHTPTEPEPQSSDGMSDMQMLFGLLQGGSPFGAMGNPFQSQRQPQGYPPPGYPPQGYPPQGYPPPGYPPPGYPPPSQPQPSTARRPEPVAEVDDQVDDQVDEEQPVEAEVVPMRKGQDLSGLLSVLPPGLATAFAASMKEQPE